jgi:hypothetical protein
MGWFDLLGAAFADSKQSTERGLGIQQRGKDPSRAHFCHVVVKWALDRGQSENNMLASGETFHPKRGFSTTK